MQVVIRPDLSSLRASLNALGSEAVRAETRALNRTIEGVRVQARRALAADTGLAQKYITPSLAIKRATFSDLEARLDVTGRRIPLYAFGARQTARGVTYRIPNRGRGLILSGFIQQMRSGHFGVFRRAAAQGPLSRRKRGGRRRAAAGELMVGRHPIVERFGPSLPHVFVQDKIRRALEQYAVALLEKNLAQQIGLIGSQQAAA